MKKTTLFLMIALSFTLVRCSTLTKSETPRETPREIPRSMASGGDDDSSDNNFIFSSDAWESISSGELKNYKTLIVLSDIHGQLDKLTKLLMSEKAGKLIVTKSDWFELNPKLKNTLLVFVGDYLNKGEDSIGVIRLLSDLQAQAKARNNNNKVVLLLGNHELEYLAAPARENGQLLNNANKEKHRNWLTNFRDLKTGAPLKLTSVGNKIKANELAQSHFHQAITTFKYGAKIGSWLFLHSGFLQTTPGDVENYFAEINRRYEGRHYSELIDASPYSSPIIAHNWQRKKGKVNRVLDILDAIGAEGMIFGHDPDAFSGLYETKDWQGHITTDTTGRLFKVDVGMSNEENDGATRNDAAMLKCSIEDILKKPSGSDSFSMSLVDSQRKALCVEVSAVKDREIIVPNN